MKQICVFLLSALAAFSADFVTGQAARLVIGQPTFTAEEQAANQTVVGGVSGLAYFNDMLFVADSNRVAAHPDNNRVLIFKNLSQVLPRPTDDLDARFPEFARCRVCAGAADIVLGQTDFQATAFNLTRTGLRTPTSVATDGRVLAIADTNNNRVLIWTSIPTTNAQPADVVVGQSDFTKNATSIPPNNKSMRGPQGVWIQNGKLYVADTQNHRVLIYNSIPSSNGAAADVVLGQPDFNTFVEPDLTQAKVDAKPNNMLNPVSVTSDGQRLYITDLGHNRVLIWNSLPASNQAPADLALGQPDMTSATPNNSSNICAANGKDDKGKDTFPARCAATLSFPRYALSDGQRLFVADGGNDRVLVYKQVPTSSGQPADIVLGQPDDFTDQASTAANSLRTPMSLAWDGTNLYVSDSYNRRILAYSAGVPAIPLNGIRNAASLEVFAVGTVTFAGAIKENDEITITIQGKDYKYKIVKDDTFDKVVTQLVALINAPPGDPNVLALPNTVVQGIVLTARKGGEEGNGVTYSTTASTGAQITATTGGASLNGGQSAASIAPGTIVTITTTGDGTLSDGTASEPGTGDSLPTELAGTQVYFDGIRAPLLFVSPNQINAQIPFEVQDATSISAYVRTRRKDGSVTVTSPVGINIVLQNPGIFADSGPDPRPGVVYHSSKFATGTISVDGTIKAGDVATVTIEDRAYPYTVQSTDTLESVRNALIDLINTDFQVNAYPAGVFTRIRLRAIQPGPDGDGVRYAASVPTGSNLILSATGAALCCASGGGRVTGEDPASPGETIVVYATGLGQLQAPADQVITGQRYKGPVNRPNEFVSSLAGGKTANVLLATLEPNMVGVYRLELELNSDIPTNPFTQLTIAQDVFVSNIITFPVVNPNPAP